MSRREHFDAGHGNPEYVYRVNHTPGDSTVVAAARKYGDEIVPVGGFKIDHDYTHDMAYEQVSINDDEWQHGIGEDPDGQQKWTGGWMDHSDHPAQVSWLGMNSSHAGPSVLSNMVSLGIAHFGRMPYADSMLTEDGARISRRMAHKYGMKGHPNNPDMEQTIRSSDREQANEEAAFQAHVAWTHHPLDSSRVREYTHAQASEIHRGVEDDYRLSKQKPEGMSDEDWAAEKGRRPGRGQQRLF